MTSLGCSCDKFQVVDITYPFSISVDGPVGQALHTIGMHRRTGAILQDGGSTDHSGIDPGRGVTLTQTENIKLPWSMLVNGEN